MSKSVCGHDRDSLLAAIDKAAKSRRNDWPGLPLAQLWITTDKDVLHGLINEGTVQIVERPAKVDPTRKAAFACRVA